MPMLKKKTHKVRYSKAFAFMLSFETWLNKYEDKHGLPLLWELDLSAYCAKVNARNNQKRKGG